MKLLHHAITRWIIAALSFVAIVGIGRSFVSLWQKSTVIGTRERMLASEKARNDQLTHQLTEATGSAYIEKIARNKLGLVKPEDTVVLMGKGLGIGSKQEASEILENLPVWQRWWKLFF